MIKSKTVMTKEEILQQVKDSFAQEQGFTDWEEYYYEEGADFNELEINQIAERYAVFMCEGQKCHCAQAYENLCHELGENVSYSDINAIMNTKNVAE